MQAEDFTQSEDEFFTRLGRMKKAEELAQYEKEFFGRMKKTEYFGQTQKESLTKLGRKKEADFFEFLDILSTLQNSYQNCIEEYKPVVEETGRFYCYYRILYDQKPRACKRFLLILSKILIKITNYIISIKKSFEKMNQELEFVHVITDCRLTSAIEFFVESANRIHHNVVIVEGLNSDCVKNLKDYRMLRKYWFLRKELKI